MFGDSTHVEAQPSDSLQLADSLMPADSLQFADSIASVGPQPIEPGDIFGQTSILVPASSPTATSPEQFNLCDTLTFRLIAFALLLFYCAALMFYRSQAASLRRIMGNRMHTEKLLEERNFIFKHFLTCFSLIGALVWPLAFMRIANIFGINYMALQFPELAVAITFAVLVVALLLFHFYRQIMLKLAGWLTLSADFTESLFLLTKMVFTFTTMLLTPVVLLLLLSRDPLSGKVLVAVVGGGLIFGLGMFLFKTFNLFRSQKVSILHWFLYLCAVEIFPVSFVALAVVRNGG